MESSNLISILERKVSAHSWNNQRAFLFSLVLPHFPRNFLSGSTSYYSLAWRATLWARQVSGQMSLVESSLLTQPRRGKSLEGLLPQWAACMQADLAWLLISSSDSLLFVRLLQKFWKNWLWGLACGMVLLHHLVPEQEAQWVDESWKPELGWEGESTSLLLSLGLFTASKFFLCSKYILSWWNVNAVLLILSLRKNEEV